MDLLLSTITFLTRVWMVFLLVPLPYSNLPQKSPSENLLLRGQHGSMRVESGHYFAYASRNPQLPDQPIFQDIAALHTRRLTCRLTDNEAVHYETLSMETMRKLVTVNERGEVFWNRKYSRQLIMNSSWTLSILLSHILWPMEESTQHSSGLGLSTARQNDWTELQPRLWDTLSKSRWEFNNDRFPIARYYLIQSHVFRRFWRVLVKTSYCLNPLFTRLIRPLFVTHAHNCKRFILSLLLQYFNSILLSQRRKDT